MTAGFVQQCGVDSFSSACFIRYFTLENLVDKFGSARELQQLIPRPRDTLFPARYSLPFSPRLTASQSASFDRMYQVASTGSGPICLRVIRLSV